MLRKSAIVLVVVCLSTPVVTAEEASTPKGLEYCTVCHGSQLMGNVNIGAPRLSGLPQWYIERQLLNFKQGLRGTHSDDMTGAEMRPMVSNLSEQDIKNIAAWAASTDSAKPQITLKADATAGKNLFLGCAACHGNEAQGNEMTGAPALSGLNDWYIATQLNHFRTGLRGQNTADVYGQQMRAASSMLSSEQDAADLAAYIAQLK